MTKSKHAHTLVGRLTFMSFVIVILMGQYYIASTFAGTRRPYRTTPIPTATALSPAWIGCASIIASSLTDIGDAGRLWLRYAFVGTNPENDQLPPDQTDDKFRCRCLIPQLYPHSSHPRVTAIVQSFNHHKNVANISSSLKLASTVDEIIVSEDGSTDGSLHDWHAALKHDSHFIIRSNNLHELRAYNRAMRIASGDIIILLQDDDLLPMTDAWVRNAQRLFDTLPELGILGGYIGQTWDHVTGQGFEYGDQKSSHGGVRDGNTKPLQFIEPTTRIPFMYSECTWIAPLFIRNSLIRRIGGLELTIAKRGEPGVWQDCVISYEAWVNGYTVGTFHAPFERGVGGHGSASSSAKLKQRERVYQRAVIFANRNYPRKRVHNAVLSLNNQTLIPRPM